ncbi:hypothetical protein FGRMN_8237 [Fusarium graminum]|nr:hypothetical protein FGRMN_8237 [Fusarium graminum]
MYILQYLTTLISSVVSVSLSLDNTARRYTAPWETLPPTPPLPEANFNGTVPINGIDLWYATFGAPLEESRANGLSPVVFLHGGFANSDYYSHQIKYMQDQPFTLIAIDSRGQGRSGDDCSRPLTYDIMTQDVVALMDHLEIDRFSTVGWSDGACISFDLAMNFTQRIDRIFSFGGTYSPSNINATAVDSPVFKEYLQRVEEEYNRNSPSKETFEGFSQRIDAMWSTEPVWNASSFSKIPSRHDDPDAPIIWIVDGDSEEAVTRDTPGVLRSWIWGSNLVILPGFPTRPTNI